MSVPLRVILSLLLFVQIFFISITNARAGTVSPSDTNENTPTVTITFSNLSPGKEYTICKDSKQRCSSTSTAYLQKLTADASGQISFIACGANDTQIKINSCSDSDYFHANTYKVFLYDNSNKIDQTQFTVKRYIPEITFLPPNPKPSDPLTVKICQPRWPYRNADRNTYDFDFKGTFAGSDPPDVKISSGQYCTESNFGPLAQGDYTLNVRYNGEDYVLQQFIFTVDPNGGSVQSIKDPKGSGNGKLGENPCSHGTSGECKTALGNISTDPNKFATKILQIASGLGGGIALILMVIGSIKVLTSSGDQQKLSGGRDQIVAAIAGLIFIIFSVLILRFVGIEILGL